MFSKLLKRLGVGDTWTRSALDNSGDGAWSWNITENSLDLSAPWKKMLGYAERELDNTPESWKRLLHPDDLGPTEDFLRDYLERREHRLSIEHRLLRKNGSYLWVWMRGAAVWRADGKPERMTGLISDISGQKYALQAVERREERISLALEASHIGFWDWDMVRDEIRGNPMQSLLIGRMAGDGRHLLRLENIHIDDRHRVSRELELAIAEKSDFSCEFRVYWQDGSVHWLLSRGRCRYDENGAAYRMNGTTKEITDRKLIEEELRIARAKAETSSETKSQFLANMSHEIRTPINAILGLSELLLDGDHNAETQRKIQLIETSAESLLSIVNDVLDYSKIEANKFKLNDLEFKPAALLNEILELFLPQAWNKSLSLKLNCDVEETLELNGDSGRIRQVLLNLMSNALKFTSRGMVVIDAKTRVVGDQAYFKVQVTDSGIGIGAEDQTKLFNPFVQSDASASRKFGGTGLGLSISRQILRLMGGDLCVESRLGVGSTFWFELELPLAPPKNRGAQNSEASALAPSPASTEPSKGRILLGEDNSLNREIARDTLHLLGYEVETAANGHEIIESLKKGDFDLVLMDCQMPVIDGYQATKIIRGGNGVRDATVPVIALTASAMKGDRERCLASGMNDYLSKPIKRRELAEKLEQWVVPRETKRAA